MKQNDISSLIFSLQSENKIKVEDKKDAKSGEVFSSLMKEETGKPGDKKTSDKLVYDDKKVKEEKEDIREKLAKSIIQNNNSISSMLNYLYQLILKNPDALSISEKQILGKYESEKGKVDTEKLRQMLSSKGLSINDLSSKQVEKLMKIHDEKQLAYYLEEIAREKKGIPALKTEEATGREEAKLGLENVKPAKDLKREEVIKQIINQILIRNIGAQDKEIVIKMNPEYLGELKIVLEVKNNEITAKFETTSKAVKDIIMESEKELSSALKDQKLHLAGIEAEVVKEIS